MQKYRVKFEIEAYGSSAGHAFARGCLLAVRALDYLTQMRWRT